MGKFILGLLSAAVAVFMWFSVAPSMRHAQPSPVSAESGIPPLKQFVTHHTTKIGGQSVAFTATAGETYVTNDGGQPIGSVFSYAYVKDAPAGSNRPVMFITGGGPGSASHFLNVGLLGPWSIAPDRLERKDSKQPGVTPPFSLIDNSNSLLDVTDLVFVDTVGTGYSRMVGDGKPEDFWGIDEDLDKLSQFIELWLSKNGRWNSPKFFLGESYGGIRATMLPAILMGGPMYGGYLRAISLNGVVVLVNSMGSGIAGEGIGAVGLAATEVPNYAAAAWYHQKIDRRGRSLEVFYEEATQFALGPYAEALRKEADKTLAAAERADIVAKLQEFTGLPPSAYEKKLSISRGQFASLLLADQGLEVGAYDSRYTFPHRDGPADPVVDDAALGRSFPVLTGAFHEMEHAKMKVVMDRQFGAIHWRDLLQKWNMKRKTWTPYGTASANQSQELAAAMKRNDKLYVMVATGYYDLLMPPAQSRYTSEQAGMPKDRTILYNFEAGHEPYVDGKVSSGLSNAIRDMVKKASN